MSDPTNPNATASVAAPADAATAAQPAPTQPVQAAAEVAKPTPRNLPYARPQRAAQPAAQPAVSEAKPADAKPAGKPVSSRAAAMQRARADKLASELESARKTAGEVEAMRKVLGGYAADAIKPLPEAWQAHLKKLAGDDPARLLELVRETEHLRASAAPVAQSAPANSIAGAGPKSAAVADEDVAAAQQWLSLQKTAPMRAANMRMANSAAIERGLKKLATTAHN